MEIKIEDGDFFLGFFPHDVAHCPALLQVVLHVELSDRPELMEEAEQLVRLCCN